MPPGISEDKFTKEELNIVWSVINYIYNDQPYPQHLLLKEWLTKYGQHYDNKVINELLDGWQGDIFKALYDYNRTSNEALQVLKKKLEEIATSGHNHGN